MQEHVEVPRTFDDKLAAAIKEDVNTGEKNYTEWTVRFAPTMISPAQVFNGVTVRDDEGKFSTFLILTEGETVHRVVLPGAVGSRVSAAQKRLQRRNRSRASREVADRRMAEGHVPFTKKEEG